jgi:hypothetical protein
LTQALQTSVSALYLGNNTIRFRGTHNVQGISQFGALTALSLCNNILCNEDLWDLKRLGHKLPSLKVLDLDGNDIQRCPHYRSHVLSAFPRLQKLDKRQVSPDEVANAPGIVKQEEHILHLLFANHCLLHKLKYIEKVISVRGEVQHTALGVFSSWRGNDQTPLLKPRFNIDLMLQFWDYESEAANNDEEWSRVLSLMRATAREEFEHLIKRHVKTALYKPDRQQPPLNTGSLRFTGGHMVMESWTEAYGNVSSRLQREIAARLVACEGLLQTQIAEQEKNQARQSVHSYTRELDGEGWMSTLEAQEDSHMRRSAERESLLQEYQEAYRSLSQSLSSFPDRARGEDDPRFRYDENDNDGYYGAEEEDPRRRRSARARSTSGASVSSVASSSRGSLMETLPPQQHDPEEGGGDAGEGQDSGKGGELVDADANTENYAGRSTYDTASLPPRRHYYSHDSAASAMPRCLTPGLAPPSRDVEFDFRTVTRKEKRAPTRYEALLASSSLATMSDFDKSQERRPLSASCPHSHASSKGEQRPQQIKAGNHEREEGKDFPPRKRTPPIPAAMSASCSYASSTTFTSGAPDQSQRPNFPQSQNQGTAPANTPAAEREDPAVLLDLLAEMEEDGGGEFQDVEKVMSSLRPLKIPKEILHYIVLPSSNAQQKRTPSVSLLKFKNSTLAQLKKMLKLLQGHVLSQYENESNMFRLHLHLARRIKAFQLQNDSNKRKSDVRMAELLHHAQKAEDECGRVAEESNAFDHLQEQIKVYILRGKEARELAEEAKQECLEYLEKIKPMAARIRTKQEEKELKDRLAQQALEDTALLLGVEVAESRATQHHAHQLLRTYFRLFRQSVAQRKEAAARIELHFKRGGIGTSAPPKLEKWSHLEILDMLHHASLCRRVFRAWRMWLRVQRMHRRSSSTRHQEHVRWCFFTWQRVANTSALATTFQNHCMWTKMMPRVFYGWKVFTTQRRIARRMWQCGTQGLKRRAFAQLRTAALAGQSRALFQDMCGLKFNAVARLQQRSSLYDAWVRWRGPGLGESSPRGRRRNPASTRRWLNVFCFQLEQGMVKEAYHFWALRAHRMVQLDYLRMKRGMARLKSAADTAKRLQKAEAATRAMNQGALVGRSFRQWRGYFVVSTRADRNIRKNQKRRLRRVVAAWKMLCVSRRLAGSSLRHCCAKRRQRALSHYFRVWDARAFRKSKVQALAGVKAKLGALRQWKRVVKSEQFAGTTRVSFCRFLLLSAYSRWRARALHNSFVTWRETHACINALHIRHRRHQHQQHHHHKSPAREKVIPGAAESSVGVSAHLGSGHQPEVSVRETSTSLQHHKAMYLTLQLESSKLQKKLVTMDLGSQELERSIQHAVREEGRLKAHVDELQEKADHAHRCIHTNHLQASQLETEFQERLRVLAELKMQVFLTVLIPTVLIFLTKLVLNELVFLTKLVPMY